MNSTTTPLTKHQKASLILLARRAWRRAGAGEEFEPWRLDQIRQACGKDGLRCATQADFLAIRGHFLHLAGDSAGAFADHLRSQTEPKRAADFHLARALSRAGLEHSYAESIARTVYRRPISDLSAKQTWHIIFTIRTRSADRRGTAKPERRSPRPASAPSVPLVPSVPSIRLPLGTRP